MRQFRRPDLADNVTVGAIETFLCNVVELANDDFNAGRQQYGRTGAEIIELVAGSHRKFHVSMASFVYNKTLWTLESSGKS